MKFNYNSIHRAHLKNLYSQRNSDTNNSIRSSETDTNEYQASTLT